MDNSIYGIVQHFQLFFRLRCKTWQRPCAIQDINYLCDCHSRRKSSSFCYDLRYVARIEASRRWKKATNDDWDEKKSLDDHLLWSEIGDLCVVCFLPKESRAAEKSRLNTIPIISYRCEVSLATKTKTLITQSLLMNWSEFVIFDDFFSTHQSSLSIFKNDQEPLENP